MNKIETFFIYILILTFHHTTFIFKQNVNNQQHLYS
jgi:hypothetical protein